MNRIRTSPKGVAVTLWVRRHVLGLAVASFVLMLGAFALSAYANVRTSDEGKARVASVRKEARQRGRVDTARTAQLEWDRKANDHSTCLRQSDGRAEVRHSFANVLDLIESSVPATSPNRAEVVVFVEKSKAAVESGLSPLKCNKVAPLPTGTRPTIPAVYASCDEAKNAGAVPLHRGDPGYSVTLDADRDGLACE